MARSIAKEWARLKVSWKGADFDTKTDTFWAVFGFVLMTAAVILQFGWRGTLFMLGWTIWKIGMR